MRAKTVKAISVILTLVMVITAIPLSVSAVSNNIAGGEYSITFNSSVTYTGEEVNPRTLDIHVIRELSGVELKYSQDWVLGDWYAVDGEQYTEIDYIPSEEGEYAVDIVGTGNYVGSVKIYFSIVPGKRIGDAYIELENRTLIEGTPVSPESLGLKVVYEDTELVYGTEYTVEYSDTSLNLIDGVPSAVGEYNAKISGIGEYYGAVWTSFKIASANDISLFADAYSRAYVFPYTGEPFDVNALNIRVEPKDDELTLTEGTDYEIGSFYTSLGGEEQAIEAPTEVGQYSVRINGIGEYSGYLEVWFSIENIDKNDLSFADVYCNYSVQSGQPATAEYIGLTVSLNGKELVAGTDFDMIYCISNEETGDWDEIDYVPSEPGNYQIRLCGKGEYSGVNHATFEIENPYDVGQYGVSGKTSFPYTGSAMKFSDFNFEVWDNNYNELEEGTDYELVGWGKDSEEGYPESIDYAPTNVGEYYVKLQGIGEYSGTMWKWFKIVSPNSLELAEMSWDTDILIAGTPAAPERLNLSVVIGDKELANGTDYTVSYRAFSDEYDAYDIDYTPTEPGSYEMVLTGTGDYCDSRSISFTIVDGTDLSNIDWIRGGMHYYYTGEVIVPEVEVVLADTVISPENYVIEFYIDGEKTDFKEPGTYDVKIIPAEGSGYTGEYISYDEFSIINPNDINYADVYIDNNLYGYTGNEINPEFKVVLGNGRELESTADFTVEYYLYEDEDMTTPVSPVDVGEYRAKVTAKDGSGYYGSTYFYFDIVESNSLRLAVLSPNRATVDYNDGNVILPEFVVTMDGKKLLEGADYIIKYYKDEYDYETDEYSYVEIQPEDMEFGQLYYVKAVGIGEYSGETDMAYIEVDDYFMVDLTQRFQSVCPDGAFSPAALKDRDGNAPEGTVYYGTEWENINLSYEQMRAEVAKHKAGDIVWMYYKFVGSGAYEGVSFVQHIEVSIRSGETGVYDLTLTCPELAETNAQLYIYQDGTQKFHTASDNGVFNLTGFENGTYKAYIQAKRGVLTYAGELVFNGANLNTTNTTHCPVGDVNGDGSINVSDVSIMLLSENYGKSIEAYDLDSDETVGINDISIILLDENYAKSAVTPTA